MSKKEKCWTQIENKTEAKRRNKVNDLLTYGITDAIAVPDDIDASI